MKKTTSIDCDFNRMAKLIVGLCVGKESREIPQTIVSNINDEKSKDNVINSKFENTINEYLEIRENIKDK